MFANIDKFVISLVNITDVDSQDIIVKDVNELKEVVTLLSNEVNNINNSIKNVRNLVRR